jgi:chitodextrinase
LSPTFVTQAAATLTWTASTDNVGVTGYDLYLEGIGAGTTTQTSYAFSGLSCGTAYTLGIDAYDAAGNRSAISMLIVTTAACADTSPPTVPTNLQETASTTTSISAGWTAATDNVGVTGYRVFVDNSLAGTTATTSYTVTCLSCGTSHQVVVDAFDAAGNRSAQASATMVTATCPPPPPGDTQAPSTPTGFGVSSATQTSLTLGWNASTDNVGVMGYGVYKNGSLVASPTGTGYTLSGPKRTRLLELAREHSFTIFEDDPTSPGFAETLLHCARRCHTATRTTTSISITWTASTDNVGVAGYDLYLNGAAKGTATATSYTFIGLACATNYTIGSDAYDGAGNHSTQATTAIATSACPDTTPPSKPTGLATTGIGQNSITLSWTASTDNVGVTGYLVFVNGSQVATAPSTSYQLSGLSCGTSYTLGVAAVDAAGNGSGTATISGATAACPSGAALANLFVSPSGSDQSRLVADDGLWACVRTCRRYSSQGEPARSGR